MLVTVTGPEEASVALRFGADIIAVEDRVRETLAEIDGRCPVCITINDGMSAADGFADAVRWAVSLGAASLGAAYVKVVVSPGSDQLAAISAFSVVARQVKLIGVVLAEPSLDMALLPALARCGFVGAMLDVRDNASGNLLTQFDISRLHAFVQACHGAGLLAGLSGGLEPPDVPRLLLVAPDILGFSAAVTDAVRAMIPPHGSLRDSEDSARRRPPRAPIEAPVDRVLVNGMVLPVFIGAYARERVSPQNVRFTVEAFVRRAGRTAADMRDVFSYDLITDGIRLLVGAGHVPLVETLAEQVADMVLSYSQVTKVIVRVEKLDTGVGSVGIEIERQPARSRMQARSPLFSGG